MIEKQMPLVSVIIPVYNAAKFISRAIDSVKCQTYLNWEVIIIDDGSTDNTCTTVSKFLCENIKAFQQKNQGPAAARNLGIKKSNGEFITFLDADDEYPKNKIEIQTKELIRNPHFHFVGGKIKYILNEGHQIKEYLFEDPEEKTMTNVNFGAIMVRKNAFHEDAIGLIDQELTYAEDVDWWLRAMEQEIPFSILPEVTLHYHLHDTNMTNKLHENTRYFAMALRRSLRRRRNKGKDASLVNLHNFNLKTESKNHPTVTVIVFADENHPSIQTLQDSIKNQDYRPEKIIYLGNQLDSKLKNNDPSAELWDLQHLKNFLDKLSSSKSEFIAFGESGTLWNHKRLNAQINYLLNNPEHDGCTCRMQVSKSVSNISGSFLTSASWSESLVIRKNKIANLSITLQNDIHIASESLKIAELKTVLLTKSEIQSEQVSHQMD